MMNPEIKAQWVAALRSGEYKKGIGVLHRAGFKSDDPDKSTPDEFCCLGVLCDLAVKAGIAEVSEHPESGSHKVYTPTGEDYRVHGETTFPPTAVQEWAGMDHHSPAVTVSGSARREALAALNDTVYGTFDPIADLIESQL